jgi:hypothetical protein
MHSSQIVLALLALALSVSSTALAIPKLIERPVSSNTHVTISWRVREGVASQTTCVLCIVTMAVAQWMRVSCVNKGLEGTNGDVEAYVHYKSRVKNVASAVQALYQLKVSKGCKEYKENEDTAVFEIYVFVDGKEEVCRTRSRITPSRAFKLEVYGYEKIQEAVKYLPTSVTSDEWKR